MAMLPGAFLYVYLGYIGRAGLEATAGGRSRTPLEWVFLVVGLLATIVVTVYVTRLARKALKQSAGNSGNIDVTPPPFAVPNGWPWGATITALVALAALAVAVLVQVHPEFLESWFGGR
jgi:hypothetical protein